MNPPNWILKIIQEGVKIPFKTKPPHIYLPNNKSVLKRDHKNWVRSTLKEFLEYGFISKVKSIPYCCLPLQIAEHPTKLSLIHDESLLNEYVEKESFKLEGWETMFELCNTATHGIQFDLKKFYFHVPIHENYRRYFGFSFVMENGGPIEYFIWNVMPYGYTKAPLISRHLLKPLIARW